MADAMDVDMGAGYYGTPGTPAGYGTPYGVGVSTGQAAFAQGKKQAYNQLLEAMAVQADPNGNPMDPSNLAKGAKFALQQMTDGGDANMLALKAKAKTTIDPATGLPWNPDDMPKDQKAAMQGQKVDAVMQLAGPGVKAKILANLDQKVKGLKAQVDAQPPPEPVPDQALDIMLKQKAMADPEFVKLKAKMAANHPPE